MSEKRTNETCLEAEFSLRLGIKPQEYLAEVCASLWDREIDAQLTPHTKIFNLKLKGYFASGKGYFASGIVSLQFFVKDTVPLYDKLGEGDLWDEDYARLTQTLDTPNNRNLRFTNFEKFPVFDMLLGNNDAHFNNIL